MAQATVTIASAKGSKTGTIREACEWQAEHQGAFASIEWTREGEHRFASVDHVDFDLDSIDECIARVGSVMDEEMGA